MSKQRPLLSIAVALIAAGCQRDAPRDPKPQAAATFQPAEAALPDPVPEEPADLPPDAFFEATGGSVVVVRNPEASSLGSGVEISPGVFVTNCHVLEGGSRYVIERDDKTYPMRLGEADEYHDICLLRGYAGKPHPAPTRSALDVHVGERVYALGNPQGFELTLSEGLVSQLRKASPTQSEPYIQTTAAISQGSSGGGLFDRKGRLIGISSFMWREGQNLNFAAPIDWALALANGQPVQEAADQGETSAPLDAVGLNKEAIQLINAGRAGDAIDLLERAAELEPSNAEIRGNLGYARLLSKDFEGAHKALLDALKLAPKRSATWLNLGETYAALGDKDAAVRSVVNGYMLSSRKPKVRDALARIPFDDTASEAWKEVADASLAAIDAQESAAN